MKLGVQLFSVFFACLFFMSCKPHYADNLTILHAEAILSSKPDSAFSLLLSIQHPEKLSKANNAAWCLHYTHAQYKLCMNIKSDSLIRIAVNYYNNSKLTKYSGVANYLLGCIYQLHQNNKEAMQKYKQAIKLLDNTNEPDMKGLVEFKIAYIYRLDELYSQSLIYYNKSLANFKLSNNKKYQSYAYREISDMYYQLDYPFDSVMHYSNLALKLSKIAGDSTNFFCIQARQGELLSRSNYKLSKEYLLHGYRSFHQQQVYYAAYLSYVYSKLHNIDSANYYLHISFSDTTNSKILVLKYLTRAYIEHDNRNMENAFKYMEKAYLNRDSLFRKDMQSQLYKIDKQYDLTQKEKENVVLKIHNQNNLIIITILIILGLITWIIFLLISIRYKKKKVNYLLEKQQFEFEIKVKCVENKQKRELLLSKLQNRIGNTLRFNQLKMGLLQADKQDDFMKMIAKQSIISEKEWQYYIDEVNDIFDRKLSDLSNRIMQLTHADIIVISLICLDLDISDCCNLLNMNKNTMYHRRRIIKERIGLGKDTCLEEWVLENITTCRSD